MKILTIDTHLFFLIPAEKSVSSKYYTLRKYTYNLEFPIYFPVDRLSSGSVTTKLIPFERVLASLSHSIRDHIVIELGFILNYKLLK